MILKNYAATIGQGTYTTRNIADNQNVTYAPFNQTSCYYRIQVIGQYYLSYGSGSQGQSWLDVGFGDTAENYNDIKLADPNYSNRQLTVLQETALEKGNDEIFNAIMVVRNDGASNVVVKEIGYIGNPTTSAGAPNGCVLLLRKVLDNPVTIAPGESYSFNYIIKIKNQ